MDPVIVFQPIVNLLSGLVVGYEALARLPGAEQEGFAVLADYAKRNGVWRETLARAFEIALHAGQSRPPGTRLFINWPAEFGQWPAAVGHAGEILRQVVLEWPEASMRTEQYSMAHVLREEFGVGIALDDWGVGHADPLRLVTLKPDWLKIDGSLIAELQENPEVGRLLELLAQWVQPGKTFLLAEGVETAEQVLALRRYGIRFGQGFWLGRPGREWVTRVRVPEPGRRIHDISRGAAALAAAIGVHDAPLVALAEQHAQVGAAVERAVERVFSPASFSEPLEAPWNTYISAPMLRDLVRRHMFQVLRGELDASDMTRASAIFQAHLKHGVQVAWFSHFYRKVLKAVLDAGCTLGLTPEVIEAMERVLFWDMSVVLTFYQEAAEKDAETGLWNATAFRFRVDAGLNRLAHEGGRGSLLIARANWPRNMSYRDLKTHWKRVGEVWQSFNANGFVVGRLSDRRFAAWLEVGGDAEGGQAQGNLWLKAVQSLGPDTRWNLGVAQTGVDGWSWTDLLAAGEQRLRLL